MLDRLDLQIEVPALASKEVLAAPAGESSASVRVRVLAARQRQRQRGRLNAVMPGAALRVARTIADLADEERVTALGVAEAFQYRSYESRRIAGA